MMPDHLRSVLLIVVVFTVFCPRICVGQTERALTNEAAFTALDADLRALVEEVGLTGAAVGLVLGPDLVFAQGYGVAELETARAITPAHVFHWASVSKPLVAIAVMQLVEAGTLDLDARLMRYLPSFEMDDERYRDITLRHLLSHTAGMPDVEDYEWDTPQTDDQALARWVRDQSNKPLLFAPGTDQAYSNIGFEVLGAVIAAVSGQSFEAYMTEHIFEPLGMKSSSFLLADIDPALRVSGHVGDNPRRVSPFYPYNRRHAPSSTLNSNIEDMALLVRVLLHGGDWNGVPLLDRALLDTMWTPRWTLTEDPFRGRALGWGVQDYEGYTMVGHAGGDDGFRSYLALLPEQQIGVLLEINDDIGWTSDQAEPPILRMLDKALKAALATLD